MKKIIPILLVLLLVSCSHSQKATEPFAISEEKTDLSYNDADEIFAISGGGMLNFKVVNSVKKTVEVTGLSNDDYEENIVIPESVIHNDKTYTVVSIRGQEDEKNIRGAFALTDIVTIQLPNTIETIGENAFSKCRKLNSINIPSSVETIGDGAFAGCDVRIDSKSNNYVVRDDALFTRDMKKLIYVPTSKTNFNIPNGVTTIGDNAFLWCSELEKIDIPNGVTSIGENAFKYCSK